ncbi:hypothetical protein NX059_006862 [Plenodomus lindquistii]|nr:hypothetical protein NX059_006862 [Plenodomus lindquistii]
MNSIPILDFADYEGNTEDGRSSFCTALYAALSEYGFAKIVHHGIPDRVLEDAFSWSTRFFGMPIEQKKKAAHPSRPNPHRGWSSVGQEKLSMIRQGKAVLDLKVRPPGASAHATHSNEHPHTGAY